MHPSVENAIQEIDAAVFNGDTFYDEEARAMLAEYVASWTRVLEEIDEELNGPDEVEDD